MAVYDWSKAQDAKRTVQALLPSHLRVEVSVLNYGRAMGIAVISGNYVDGMAYNFGMMPNTEASLGRELPDFDRAAALRIADDWRTGAYLPAAPAAARQVGPNIPIITTRDGLVEWVTSAKKGAQCCYFKGNLAQFRNDAPGQIVALQKKHDGRKGKADPLAADRVRESTLRRTLELVDHTRKLFNAGMITFSQRREGKEGETIYLATRIGGHMSEQRSQQTESMHLQKEMRNAITQNWAKFAKEFRIAHIDFEGTQDKIHDITAKVEIYKADPQNPQHMRIAYRDLGRDRKRWPAVLEQRGKAAVKQVRMRDQVSGSRVVDGKKGKVHIQDIE